jgi:hypothetical protein
MTAHYWAACTQPPPAGVNFPGLSGGHFSRSVDSRIIEIRDNLQTRMAEAEREGWFGEVEGLQISLAGANEKIAHIDRRSPRTIDLGMPNQTAVTQSA